MQIFKFMKFYIKKYKLYFFIFLLLSVVTFGISLIVPYMLGNYIDSLIVSKSKSVIFSFTKAIAIFSLIDIISSYYRDITMEKIKSKIAFNIINDVIEHVKKLPLSFFYKSDSGYLNQRIIQDSHNITNFVFENFVNIILKILTLIVLAILIFKMNIKIFFLLLIFIPLNIISYFIFKNKLYKKAYIYQESQSNFFSKMNEQFSTIKLIKVNSWFNISSKKLKNTFDNLYNSLIKYVKIVFYFNNTNNIIRYFSTVGLIFIGGYEILNSRLTIGKFTAINSYFSIALGSITYLLNLGKAYQDSLVSYNRLKEISELATEPNGERVVSSISSIRLDNVYFNYDEKRVILNDFSYEFTKGNIYCILGKNGLGKSTLIDVMMGIKHNYDGEIFYNDIDMRFIDMYNLRQNRIGIVEQEPVLLRDTIRTNLLYGIDSFNENELVEKCKLLDIYKFISNIESEVNYTISQNNYNISGGEKQKISLVRALIKDPDVLILDEPISALDSKSIKNLKQILKKIKNDKIIILITHNNEILDIVDEVIDLNQVNLYNENQII